MLEIKKRNGTIAPFDASKITKVMEKAFVASSWPYSTELLDEMTR